MTRRKGLVLEGGGAKGAYAFGWLLEFAARGVKFDAVAGTSVGALNATLWASGQIETGEQVWRSISTETTLAFRRPRWLWSILLLPYGLQRLLGEALNEVDDPVVSSYTAFFGAAILSIPPMWLATEIARQTILMVGILINPPLGLNEITLGLIGFIQLWLVLVGVIFTALAIMAPGAFDDVVRLSWRSSKPLRETIRRVVARCELAIPTYVTVAEYRLVSDPERLRFQRGKTVPRGFWFGHLEYVPVYVPLHDTPKHRVMRFVLASASLPYGITLPVRDKDRLLVDGGVVDNSPATPLIISEHCDLVVVVKLRQGPSMTSCDFRKNFLRLERRRQAAALTSDDADRMRARGEKLIIEEPAVWPDLETIVPSRPLGSLLSSGRDSGTGANSSGFREFRAMLRFEPEFVARLIALGRADAAAQPPEFWRRLGAVDT